MKRFLADPSHIDVADGYAIVPLLWVRQHPGEMAALQMILLRASEANQTHTSTQEFLNSYKPNIDKRDGNGFTALQYAVADGDMDLARHLVSYGADVNCKSGTNNDDNDDEETFEPDGPSAIAIAVKRGDMSMFKFLIEKGANFDGQRGLLHYPIASQVSDTSRELLTLLLQVPTASTLSVTIIICCPY